MLPDAARKKIKNQAPSPATTANSQSGLAGLKAAEGIAMMLRVHRAEKVGGRFVLWVLLPTGPFQEQTVAQVPEHRHQAHRLAPTPPTHALPMPQDNSPTAWTSPPE
jgi:hypothetical protein